MSKKQQLSHFMKHFLNAITSYEFYNFRALVVQRCHCYSIALPDQAQSSCNVREFNDSLLFLSCENHCRHNLKLQHSPY